MDLLLQQFIEEHYDNLTAEEQTAFRLLLDQPDPDIMDWVMGKTEPPTAEIKHLIDILRTISLRHPA
jgi:antitoxin CptB